MTPLKKYLFVSILKDITILGQSHNLFFAGVVCICGEMCVQAAWMQHTLMIVCKRGDKKYSWESMFWIDAWDIIKNINFKDFVKVSLR
jgi:hypothetical protein